MEWSSGNYLGDELVVGSTYDRFELDDFPNYTDRIVPLADVYGKKEIEEGIHNGDVAVRGKLERDKGYKKGCWK